MTISIDPAGPIPDADLVAQIRDGETGALGILYDRHGRPLLRLLGRLLGSRADAEDLLHEVFLALPSATARYDERGTFGPWLRAVAVRRAMARMRSRRRRRESPIALVDEEPAHRAPDPHLMLAVQQALDALPTTLRVVFVLRELEGYSHAEIGQMVGIRTGTSEVRLHRALRRLRHSLREIP